MFWGPVEQSKQENKQYDLSLHCAYDSTLYIGLINLTFYDSTSLKLLVLASVNFTCWNT